LSQDRDKILSCLIRELQKKAAMKTFLALPKTLVSIVFLLSIWAPTAFPQTLEFDDFIPGVLGPDALTEKGYEIRALSGTAFAIVPLGNPEQALSVGNNFSVAVGDQVQIRRIDGGDFTWTAFDYRSGEDPMGEVPQSDTASFLAFKDGTPILTASVQNFSVANANYQTFNVTTPTAIDELIIEVTAVGMAELILDNFIFSQPDIIFSDRFE